jgi:hypothetical protein
MIKGAVPMTEFQKKCPKCDGEMVQGFIPDFSYGGSTVSSWHAGAPKESLWKGTKVNYPDGIPIGAFRCSNCGFLEFYADDRFTAS